jgi:hypothetical protein
MAGPEAVMLVNTISVSLCVYTGLGRLDADDEISYILLLIHITIRSLTYSITALVTVIPLSLIISVSPAPDTPVSNFLYTRNLGVPVFKTLVIQ